MKYEVQKQYISNLQKSIKNSSRLTKQFINALNKSISNYLTENPNASYYDLEKTFGTIDEVTESYYDSLNSDEIRGQISHKKKLFICCLSTLVIIGIICGLIYGNYYYNLNKDLPSYSIDEIEIITDTTD
ncbi:DUF6120 family protein [Eubacterium sp.]